MSDSFNTTFVNKIISEFQLGNKKESFEKLSQFLIDNPNNDVARYNFAIMCEKLNYYNLATKNYTQINKRNKRN